MFQQLKLGQEVVDIVNKKKGIITAINEPVATVDFVIGQNLNTRTKTIEQRDVLLSNLYPANTQSNEQTNVHYQTEVDNQYNPYKDVQDFHIAFSHPVASVPTPMSPERASQRGGYKIEELVEFLWASVQGDEELTRKLVAQLKVDMYKALDKVIAKGSFPKEEVLLHQVDAVTDMNYFNYGTFAELGVDPRPIFKIVQSSNLSKLDSNNQPIIDPITNKIQKSENFIEPEPMIKAEIQRQINEKMGY